MCMITLFWCLFVTFRPCLFRVTSLNCLIGYGTHTGPQRELVRSQFSRFWRAHGRDQHTDRPRFSVCSSRMPQWCATRRQDEQLTSVVHLHGLGPIRVHIPQQLSRSSALIVGLTAQKNRHTTPL